MDFKSFSNIEYKTDTDKREVTGYAAFFGNKDLLGDVIHPGAFKKTLQERFATGQIKTFFCHSQLIGKPVHMEEDSTGLLTVSKISKTKLGDEVLTFIADGAINSMSIGYETIKEDFEERDDIGEVRNLREIKLFEFGPVIFPANESARILGVKLLGAENVHTLQSLLGMLAQPTPVTDADEEKSQSESEEKLHSSISEMREFLRTIKGDR